MRGTFTRTAFVQGAMDVGGLTRTEAEAAWIDDDLAQSVPVAVTDVALTQKDVAPPGSIPTPDAANYSASDLATVGQVVPSVGGGDSEELLDPPITDEASTAEEATVAAATYTYRSTSRTVKRDWNNYLGLRLFTFKMTKYWEYNGNRVRNIAVSTHGDVSNLGACCWAYDGISESEGSYKMWEGSQYGKHWSKRRGKFTSFPYGSNSIAIHITGRGDGTAWRGIYVS